MLTLARPSLVHSFEWKPPIYHSSGIPIGRPAKEASIEIDLQDAHRCTALQSARGGRHWRVNSGVFETLIPAFISSNWGKWPRICGFALLTWLATWWDKPCRSWLSLGKGHQVKPKNAYWSEVQLQCCRWQRAVYVWDISGQQSIWWKYCAKITSALIITDLERLEESLCRAEKGKPGRGETSQ